MWNRSDTKKANISSNVPLSQTWTTKACLRTRECCYFPIFFLFSSFSLFASSDGGDSPVWIRSVVTRVDGSSAISLAEGTLLCAVHDGIEQSSNAARPSYRSINQSTRIQLSYTYTLSIPTETHLLAFTLPLVLSRLICNCELSLTTYPTTNSSIFFLCIPFALGTRRILSCRSRVSDPSHLAFFHSYESFHFPSSCVPCIPLSLSLSLFRPVLHVLSFS